MEQKGKKLAVFRIVVDVLMLLLIATLYNRRAISQLYHEIAGLALIVLFIVHLLINRKQIRTMAEKREVSPGRLRFMKVLDVLLCAAWLAVFVTGILASQRIFSFHMRMLNPWHQFTSAIALLLTGVHFGMHWKWFWGMIRKAFSNPKTVTAVLLTFVLIFGGYCLFTSNYLRWISAPFSTRQMRGEGRFGRDGGFSERGGENAPWDNGENGRWDRNAEGENTPADKAAEGENAPANENTDTPQEPDSENAPEQQEGELPSRGDGEDGEAPWGEGRRGRRNRGDGDEDAWGEGRRGRRNRGDGEEDAWGEGRRGRRNRGDGEGRGWGGNRGDGEGFRRNGGRRGNGDRFMRQSNGLVRFFGSFIKGLGILLFFGAVTHGVDLLLGRKKKTDSAADSEAPPETETPPEPEAPKETE